MTNILNWPKYSPVTKHADLAIRLYRYLQKCNNQQYKQSGLDSLQVLAGYAQKDIWAKWAINQ